MSPTYQPLWDWMEERQRIAERRARGDAKPWTQDYALRHFRFCNVRREDDVVSRWIHDNIVIPFADDTDLVARVTFARHINLPRTLEQLPSRLDIDEWIQVLDRAKRPIWNSAYMIRARPGSPLYPSKHADVLKSTIAPMRGVSLRGLNLQYATERLMGFWAMGGFMSYEVVCDLRWLPGYLDTSDVYTWGNVGPGAARGLKRLGLPPTTEGMVTLLRASESVWPVGRWGRPLEVRDIEHSLCELDKYQRINEGRYGGRTYDGA